MSKHDRLLIKVTPPPEVAEPMFKGPQLPEEVAPANYTLSLPCCAEDPVIPASIVEIGDSNASMVVTATFPGHPELAEVGPFQVGLDGDDVDVVEIRCFEHEAGEYDNLPLAGAVKGVFMALVEAHRRDLDLLRMNVAYVAGIRLKPAGVGDSKEVK